MPKNSPEVVAQSNDPLAKAFNEVLVQSASTPTVVCGVGRKVNIGNYENVDLYFGVTLPVVNADLVDFENLKAQLTKVAEEGFSVAAKETGERYLLIKQTATENKKQAEKKPEKPEEEQF